MADLTRKTANLVNLPTWSNPITDTRDQLQLIIRLYKNDVIVAQSLFNISTLGYFTSYSPVAGADFDRICIKHNGSRVDISIINMPFDGKKNQQIWFSAIALGTNPTTVGGLSFKDIMLNVGDSALPYEPYWQHSLRKLTTATEAVENPLYSDGTAITAYTIKCNTVQNGTPTQSNPVEVNGVGVRTENLSTIFSPNTASSGGMNFEGVGDKLRLYGDTDTYVQCINTNNINLAAGTYTISASSTRNNSACYVQFRSEDGTSTYATIPLNSPTTVTFNTAVSGRIRVICQASTYYNTDEIISIMINEGSTAKPYEPYGYKIPISSGGVTTNIYLGSTQTVRQIKKLVLDGAETWYINNQSTVNAFFSMVLANPSNVNLGISTHFIFKGIYTSNDDVGFYVTTTGELRIRPDNVSSMTKSDFTTWLSQQYANGTPVTVWHVLATPETAAINEPLMKIGDYADTLSNAASIPTTEGANSITVDTTVQPSEFTATWTGWHDASVKEWDGSDWS